MREISNLRSVRANRSAFLILPVSLSIVCMAGVAARPALDLSTAEEMREAARHRLRRYRHERSELEEFEAIGGAERLGSALERIRRLVPEGASALELHSSIRMLAESHGVQLDSVVVGELVDPELPRLGDVIGMRQVSLRGSGSIDGPLRIVSALRAAAIPVAVLELGLTRSRVEESQFQVRLNLGLFELVELAGAGATPGDGGDQ